MENFTELLFQPFRKLWTGFMDFVPNLLAMFIIISAGLFIAWAVRRLLLKAFKAFNLDVWCDRIGLTSLVRKANIWTRPSDIFANVAFGFIAIITVMTGLTALRLEAIDNLSLQFFMYLPRAFSALMILIIGYVVTGFLTRAVLIAAVNSGYNYAKLLTEAVRMLLVVLILAMALEQLQIAPGIVVAAFSIIFGGIVLALAISFGVGGIDAARRVIEKSSEEKDTGDVIKHL